MIPKSNERDKCYESSSFYSPSQPDDTNSRDLRGDNLSGDELTYKEQFNFLQSFVNKVIINH